MPYLVGCSHVGVLTPQNGKVQDDIKREIKERLDLREIIERDLGPGKRYPRSIRWPCPLHNTDETIAAARLGYDPARNVIVMPWYSDDYQTLWRIGVKSLKDGLKIPYFPGWRPSLYLSDQLKTLRPVVLAEGELDALSVRQEVPEVAAVATGGITSARLLRWAMLLTQMPLVLVAFDDDAAGDKGAQWWLDVLDNARRRQRPQPDVAGWPGFAALVGSRFKTLNFKTLKVFKTFRVLQGFTSQSRRTSQSQPHVLNG